MHAGRRPEILKILSLKMVGKLCFLNRNQHFSIRKPQNFPPAAGQSFKTLLFSDLDDPKIGPNFALKKAPLVCPRSVTRGGFLKWNSPDVWHVFFLALHLKVGWERFVSDARKRWEELATHH